MPENRPDRARQIAFVAAFLGLCFGVAGVLKHPGGMETVTQKPWIPALGISYYLGAGIHWLLRHRLIPPGCFRHARHAEAEAQKSRDEGNLSRAVRAVFRHEQRRPRSYERNIDGLSEHF